MEEIDIIIRTLNQNSITIKIPSNSSVLKVKEKLAEILSISVERQRLIHKGRVLVDENTIESYDIGSGTILHMVARPENFRELQQSATQTQTPPPPRQAANGPSVIPISIQQLFSDQNLNQTSTLPTTQQIQAPVSHEHIRQSILTLHTLLSTMNYPHLQPNFRFSSSQSPTSTSPLLPPPPPPLSARLYFPGQWLDVRDTVGQWLEATVMNVRGGWEGGEEEREREIYVHYNGWPVRWDEWLPVSSPRLAPFRTRTVHTSHSPASSTLSLGQSQQLLCPTVLAPALSPPPPTTSLFTSSSSSSSSSSPSSTSSVPITTEDVRIVLPEVHRLLVSLLPLTQQASQLSLEVRTEIILF